MKIIIPSVVADATPRYNSVAQHFYMTDFALNSNGNGLNRTAFDPAGGQASISGNTIVDSFMFMWRSHLEGTGLGAPYLFWDHPWNFSGRLIQRRLDAEGEIAFGLGDFVMDATYANVRTNFTAKRVVLDIQATPLTAQFIICTGAIVTAKNVALPAPDTRITVAFQPGRATLWYNEILVADVATTLSGGGTNITGATPNVGPGVRIHKTPTGAAFNRVSFAGMTWATPDP